ncbi:MAG: LysR family transcriptional regulator [Pseudomonadota bacterium]
MLKKGITLRGIEVFETLAQTGSVAQTAAALGLSQPAISQQMRNLETAVGSELVDHTRRPMKLTLAGQLFLRRVTAALSELRQAQNEVTIMDLTHIEELSLGVIDDFDDDLTPRLVTILADSMAGCRFRMISDGSHALAKAISQHALHMAILAQAGPEPDGVVAYPLARDPFIAVVPKNTSLTVEELFSGTARLPYLRYAEELLIADQIESSLSETGATLTSRFEIGSHLAMMSMVARGIGWAITSALGYMRAARFHDGMEARAIPVPGSARQISLLCGAEWSGAVPRDISLAMRRLMQTHMIGPATLALPWLGDHFHLVTEAGA